MKMREQLNIPKNVMVFLWVGRFHHEKQPEVFIQSIANLIDNNIT